jgi:hypothetical protein
LSRKKIRVKWVFEFKIFKLFTNVNNKFKLFHIGTNTYQDNFFKIYNKNNNIGIHNLIQLNINYDL